MEAISGTGKNPVKNFIRHIGLINSILCSRQGFNYYASFSGYVYRKFHKFYPACPHSFIYINFIKINYL